MTPTIRSNLGRQLDTANRREAAIDKSWKPGDIEKHNAPRGAK